MPDDHISTTPKAAVHQEFDFTGADQSAKAIHDFVLGLRWNDIPAPVRERARLLLLDLIGVLACATATPLSRIIRDHAAEHHGAGSAKARLLFDNRVVSPPGAALATGMTIDAVDAHDGHRLTKGHVGCGALAALVAFADDLDVRDGREILTALVVGYEIGTRAARVLHEAPETAAQYHSSGAWIALAAAAIGARLMGMDAPTFRHALAIAEFHGPRSLVMKVASNPTMLKDGSGWGAMAGVSAAYLARSGFLGAPCITTEAAPNQAYWRDLGDRWEVLQQYVKPQPVCRWTQQATEAAAQLMAQHRFSGEDVVDVTVETFLEATLLSQDIPTTTEEAQYNVRFPLAVLLARGQLGAAEVADQSLFSDPEVMRLHQAITLSRNPDFDAAFPAERWARVRITLSNGETLNSGKVQARGDPETMLTTEEFVEKFHKLATTAMPSQQAQEIKQSVLTPNNPNWPTLRRLIQT